MRKKVGKILSIFLAVLMLSSILWTNFMPTTAQVNVSSSSTKDYGLPSNVQDGVILHCWDWSFNNIADQMEKIAESGYTAIQTSPIQEAKEPTKGASNSKWWLYYQPKSFTIDNSGQSGLGNKSDFERMCKIAHDYKIKVIVDIVANHTGNGGANGIANQVIDDIKNDSSCYHNYGQFHDINYGSRYSITHDSMGMLPDLNTENQKIQNYVYNLLTSCIDSGADGFRFDAAKHISVPSEGSEYSFWPNTVGKAKDYAKSKGVNLYVYGEILDGTGGPSVSEYNQYMSVTDNQASNNVRNAVNSGNASGAASSYYNKGVTGKNLVLWAESHDTYQNDDKASTGVSTDNINKTWAMVASRADAASLYYVRTQGWRAGNIGDICTWDWASKQVAEVNKFHNAMVGTTEYLSSSNNISYNERGTKGAILVNCQGTSTHVSVPAKKMEAGTYKDQITGNVFTVANGMITGDIGGTGIAVVYNPGPIVKTPVATISPAGGEFSTETLDVTIGLENATSGTYKIGNDAEKTYTSSTVLTLGKNMNYGDSTTVVLKATDGTKTSEAKSYTFTKVEKVENVAYMKLPAGWGSDVYCYAYDSATEQINNGAWPGQKMSYDSATGYYKYVVPDTIKAPRVIFYNSGTNRYPADKVPGLLFETNGSWLYADGNWGKVQETSPSATISPAGGEFNTDTLDVTIGLKNATSGTYKIGNDAEKTFTSNTVIQIGANMQYGESTTVVLKATDGKKTSDPTSYTFKKVKKEEKVTNIAYIKVPSGWSGDVYCYAYDSATEQITNGGWPGQKMTYDSATGYYKYVISDTIKAPRVIFYNSDTNRYPANMQKGLLFETDGSWLYADGNWGKLVSSPTATISKEGGEFYTDTLALTLGLKDATSATYKVGSEAEKTYTASTTITIGANMQYGESTTVVIKATDGKTTSVPKTFTFKKLKKENVENVAYIKLPSGWGKTVYCYAYDSATEKVTNGNWPGQKMTYDSSTGYYKYVIPTNIKAPRVIFYSSDTNRYPGNMQKGLLFESDGSWLYSNGNWSKYK